jgi:hypothetical protein
LRVFGLPRGFYHITRHPPTELTAQAEAQISKEIVKLQRRVKSYTGQHKRMIDLLAVDEFSKDDVLDKINQIKADKQADEARISELLQAKEKLRQLQDATIQLDQWYATARENIENADNETKRLAFEMLDIKVYATREKVHEIQGAIDANLATTERTSA